MGTDVGNELHERRRGCGTVRLPDGILHEYREKAQEKRPQNKRAVGTMRQLDQRLEKLVEQLLHLVVNAKHGSANRREAAA